MLGGLSRFRDRGVETRTPNKDRKHKETDEDKNNNPGDLTRHLDDLVREVLRGALALRTIRENARS